MFIFNIRHKSIKFFASLLISACTTTAPQTQLSTASESAQEYQTISHNTEELKLLQAQLSAIQEQIGILNKQISAMQQQQATISRYLNVHLSTKHTFASNLLASTKKSDSTAEARRLFQAGLYAQAINLLKNADSGGNGSTEAQERMWLLLLNHAHLNNCESVINIGKRFNALYPHNAHNANVLYQVAVCQNRLQQQDIARVTCQHIINTYPNSSAAAKARQLINKKK